MWCNNHIIICSKEFAYNAYYLDVFVQWQINHLL